MIRSGVLQRLPILPELLMQPAARQLIRYIIAGLGVTQLSTAIYASLVTYLALAPLMANVGSTACGLCVGYAVHSRWTFAGGAEDREHAKIGRFLLGALVAFLINSFWVWLLVSYYHLPPLAPIPLMMVATPGVSFLLNRYWVFRAA